MPAGSGKGCKALSKRKARCPHGASAFAEPAAGGKSMESPFKKAGRHVKTPLKAKRERKKAVEAILAKAAGVLDEVRLSGGHVYILLDAKKGERNGRNCARCHLVGKGRRSPQHFCRTCRVHLCTDCWQLWHGVKNR